MKKALKIVGSIFGGFIVMIIVGVIFLDSDEGPGTKVETPQVEQASAPAKEEPEAEAPAPKPEPKKEEPKNIFKFGEEVPFDSGLNVKVVNVTTTSERNQFEDPVKHVLVVSLELANTTGAEMYVTSYDFTVQDKDGFQGTPYAGGDQSVTLAPNGKARVNFQFAMEGEGPYKVVGGVATWQ